MSAITSKAGDSANHAVKPPMWPHVAHEHHESIVPRTNFMTSLRWTPLSIGTITVTMKERVQCSCALSQYFQFQAFGMSLFALRFQGFLWNLEPILALLQSFLSFLSAGGKSE